GVEPEAEPPQSAHGGNIAAVTTRDDGVSPAFVEQPVDHRARGFDGVSLPAPGARNAVANFEFARGAQRRFKANIANDRAFIEMDGDGACRRWRRPPRF